MGGCDVDCLCDSVSMLTTGHGSCYGVDRIGEVACTVHKVY